MTTGTQAAKGTARMSDELARRTGYIAGRLSEALPGWQVTTKRNRTETLFCADREGGRVRYALTDEMVMDALSVDLVSGLLIDVFLRVTQSSPPEQGR